MANDEWVLSTSGKINDILVAIREARIQNKTSIDLTTLVNKKIVGRALTPNESSDDKYLVVTAFTLPDGNNIETLSFESFTPRNSYIINPIYIETSETIGNYTYKHFKFNDKNGVLRFEFVVIKEDYAINLRKYLGEVDIVTQRNKMQEALSFLESICAKHLIYRKETSPRTLRTDLDITAMEYMDCSELVCRYIHKLGLTSVVPDITTYGMISEHSFQNGLKNKLLVMPLNSDDIKFIPQTGDIFVFRDDNGNGHTGVVKEYLADKDAVVIYEAIGDSGSRDDTFNRNNGGDDIKHRTRKAIYRRIGPALYGHPGWKGYYRPILK